MQIIPNYPLSNLTTFHVGGPCSFFVEVSSVEELKQALDFAKQKNLKVLTIGGGSNLLVSDRGIDAMVIKVSIKGITVTQDAADFVLLKVGAGEVWDEVVAFSVSKNLWGIENLSAIPGFTGAIPVQNVGAYGQEASLVVESIEILDLETLQRKDFSKLDSGFGYRTSNFNSIVKNKYVIVSVIFKLSKTPLPNLAYADVKKYFENKPNPTQLEIRQAITEIRGNKFPEIVKFGNAGSCFKNIILTKFEFEQLSPEVKTMLNEIKDKFPQPDGYKIPAAFLIDKLGLKDLSVGGAKLWEKQPLVIVNTGTATAEDIRQLFMKVKLAVFDKTGLELKPEPEFIGF